MQHRSEGFLALAAWRSAALLAHLLLIDAAIETFWSGSTQRWWISPALVLFGVASAWAWRPRGELLRRFGPAAAAAAPGVALLGLIAVSAWLPGGHDRGIRMLLQPTSKVLSGVLAIATLVAAARVVRRVALPAAASRLAALAVFGFVSLYAIAALTAGALGHSTFAALFRGGAIWHQLPKWFQGTAAATFLVLPIGLIAALVGTLGERGVAGMKRASYWTPTALALAFVIALSGYYVPAGGVPVASGEPSGARDAAKDRAGAAETLRTAALALQATGKPDAAAAADRVRYLLEQAAALRDRIPRDTFDAQAVVAAAGSDPAALFAWVRDKTFWAPYRGSLRGPAGVVMDRAGSSLDRSLLLADLLRRAGRKARLAHAQLTPDQAQALLDRVRAVPFAGDRQPRDPSALDQQVEAVLKGYAGRFSRAPESFLDAARTAREAGRAAIAGARTTAREQAALVAASIPGDRAMPRGEDARAAAADHWWVQYQQDGSWIDLDPAPSDGEPNQAIAAPTSVSDQPPPASRWTISLSVVVESWSQGRLTERRVLTHRVAAADSAWQDITLAHAPLGFPDPAGLGADAGAWRAAALGVREWVPVLLVGQRRVSQSSFTDDGTVNGRPGQKSGGLASAGGLFGALGGGETAAAADGVLTAEWVDYDIQGPGSPSRRFRRTWFDLVGPKARAASPVAAPELGEPARAERALSLLGETAILIQVCRPSLPFLADRMLRRFADHGSELLALVPGGASNASTQARTLLSRLAPASNALWRWATERFEASDVGDAVLVTTPQIATLRSEVVARPGQAARGRGVFDIVANAVSVPPSVATGRGTFESRIAQGVADTVAEAGGAKAGNTSGLFRAAADLGVPARRIASRERGWAPPPDVPGDVLARIDADVSSGHHVLVLARPVTVAGVPRLGWWRVEADTGTTVGVMDSGYRQGLSEYIGQASEIAVGLVLGYIVADWTWDHTSEERETAVSVLGVLFVLAAAGALAGAGVEVSVSFEL